MSYKHKIDEQIQSLTERLAAIEHRFLSWFGMNLVTDLKPTDDANPWTMWMGDGYVKLNHKDEVVIKIVCGDPVT